MPTTPREEPSAAEWKILKIVTERGPCAARDVVHEAAGRFAWSGSTTKTFLRRLVEKGHLKTSNVGNSFLYRPTRSALKSLKKAADTLLEKAADGTVAPLLAYMVRKSRLSEEELKELRTLLEDGEEDLR